MKDFAGTFGFADGGIADTSKYYSAFLGGNKAA